VQVAVEPDAGDSGPDADGSLGAPDAVPDDVVAADLVVPEASAPDAEVRECESNPDCAAPTSVCDTIKGRCVECLVLSDCAMKPGTICSKGVCSCPDPTQAWCAPASCVDLQSSSDDCGACGHRCYGACVAGKCAGPWEPTSEVQAPKGRAHHVAVWTGTRMIVWGGAAGCTNCVTDTGGMFELDSFSWVPTSLADAPTKRKEATAVWTGTEMLVWGGMGSVGALNTGGRFNPQSNTWTPISTLGAPTGRYAHSAVWTGTEMIVWGGSAEVAPVENGGRYDPKTDTWAPMASAGGARRNHTGVWTGSEMWIYGGMGSTGVLPSAATAGGLRFQPSSNTWSELPTPNQPSARAFHLAAMTGSKMLVWGGYDGVNLLVSGAVFDGTTWMATPAGAPTPRRRASAVSLDSPARIVIWGGESSTLLGTGASWDPQTWKWSALPTAPTPRTDHAAVSTGDRMIVWGGWDGSSYLASGAIFTP
jgi:hypothetical protein